MSSWFHSPESNNNLILIQNNLPITTTIRRTRVSRKKRFPVRFIQKNKKKYGKKRKDVDQNEIQNDITSLLCDELLSDIKRLKITT